MQGTEANTETAATIPGLGGEGTNLTRDDIIDRVRFHQGVVTNTGTSGWTNLALISRS